MLKKLPEYPQGDVAQAAHLCRQFNWAINFPERKIIKYTAEIVIVFQQPDHIRWNHWFVATLFELPTQALKLAVESLLMNCIEKKLSQTYLKRVNGFIFIITIS